MGIVDIELAPPLLFYSYLPIIAICLFMGAYVLVASKFSIISKAFLAISVFFSLWSVNALFQWIGVHADIVHFSWQIIILIEALMFLSVFYFSYVFLHNKAPSIWWQLTLSFVLFPIILFLPSRFNIAAFDLTNCAGLVGSLWRYEYILEFFIAILILYFTFKRWQVKKNIKSKEVLLGIASTFFLVLFSITNIIGDATGYYQVTLAGSIGFAVFLGAVVFLIVRYKAFNIKIIGTQALVVTLWVLTGSLLLVAKSEVTRIIVALTEIVSIIFGLILIKSVKREVAQREKIEKLASALAETNDELNIANDKLKELDKQKTEFVSVASHQLRAPTTAIKGYSSMLLEGSYGPLEEKAKQAVDVIFQSAQKLNFVIEDFLNITRIELGKMKYEITEIDFKKMIDQVFKELEPVAKRKSLDFSFSAGRGSFKVMADPSKLSQVIMNIVDNSIKYTPSGSIKARLEVKDGKRRFSITDTGVGMSEETKGRLFQKFTRAYNASASNGTGTGLGLFVAKQMIEAQGGRMWVESPGEGEGSTFFVEL